MKTLNVDDETYEKLKDQLKPEELEDIEDLDDLIGGKYFFRTVTYHLIGEVKNRIANFLLLEDAIWVADSGRFMQAIQNGELGEYEEVGKAYVNLNSVTDFIPWIHKIPKGQK